MHHPVAVILLSTNQVIQVEMYPEYAPDTVSNFVTLANKGYFEGMAFTRVVNNRLIQQGDPKLAPGQRTDCSPGYSLKGEFNKEDFSNPLSFERGTVGMAMADWEWTPYASAGSFFIMTRDEPKLDSVVPAFARVLAGMDVVDEICSSNTQKLEGEDTPDTMVYIQKIDIALNGYEAKDFQKVYKITD